MPFWLQMTFITFTAAFKNPWTDFDFGVLQISRTAVPSESMLNEKRKEYVNFRGKRVVASHRKTVFVHDGNGTLQSFDTGRYLSVDSTGIFAVRPAICYGFSLNPMPGTTDCALRVAYLENEDFEICRNGSIGQGGCEDSTKIAIVFHDIFPSDWDDQ